MIVQTENGRYRLKQEFDTLAHKDLEGCLLVSEPPPFGLTLSNSQFQADIRGVVRTFKARAVVAKRLSWLRISCPVGLKRADALREKRPGNE